MSPTTPEAVIGLELEGRGFDSANRELDKHAMGWERIEGHVGRVGSAVDSIASRVGQLAGAVGLGALISDFVRLDDVASRAALSVNRATGRSGFAPIKGAAQGAAIATSTDSRELLGAMTALQMRVGGNYLNQTSNWGTLGRSLGNFSRAYGIDLGTLGAQVGALELYQGQGVGSTQALLGQLASQAARSGQAGQTPQFLQAVATATAMLGQSHPGFTGRGTSQTLGALYGSVSGANQAFKDPSLFAAGVAGIDSGVTQAYANPRLQAALQMAGVGYWEQRGGLSGKHGKDLAGKLLRWSDQQYGHGSVEQDLFLRSQFGDVSADMLRAFSKGQVTYEQLLKQQDPHKIQGEIERRSKSDQRSAGAQLQKKREQAGKDVGGAGNTLFGLLDHLSFNDLIALGIGYKGGKLLLGKGAKRLFGRLRSKGAAAALEADQSVIGRVLRASGATEEEIAAAVAGRGGGAAAGRVLGLLGRGARFAGPAGAVAGFLMDAENAGNPHEIDRLHALTRRGDLDAARRTAMQTEGKFGHDWMNNPKAMAWAKARLHRQFAITNGGIYDMNGGAPNRAWKLLQNAIGQATHATGGPSAGGTVDKFSDAVNRFDRILRRMERDQGSHREGSSWTGNASGLQSANDVAGSNMVMASLIAGAGTGGGGAAAMSPASYLQAPVGGGGGGGGSGSGSGGGGGGSWKSCILTWYDPALGGINSGNGARDPHHATASGEPYDPNAYTCAAPSQYAFGTLIEFRYGGKTITCRVNDRGGAITGNHFDLSRRAGKELGIGRSAARFRVAGHSGGGHKRHRGGGGSALSPSVTTASAASSAHSSAMRDALAWMGGGGGSGSGGGGGGDRQAIVVHIDGREVHRQRKLTRGNA